MALVFALVVDVSPWFGGGIHGLAPLLHGRVWPALLYLGLASSCAVYVLQFYLVREVGAVQQMAVDYLTPIVGVVEGALFRCNFCNISALRLALVLTGTTLAAVGATIVNCCDGAARRKVESDTAVGAPLIQ